MTEQPEKSVSWTEQIYLPSWSMLLVLVCIVYLFKKCTDFSVAKYDLCYEPEGLGEHSGYEETDDRHGHTKGQHIRTNR
jgi:hypothetical protein